MNYKEPWRLVWAESEWKCCGAEVPEVATEKWHLMAPVLAGLQDIMETVHSFSDRSEDKRQWVIPNKQCIRSVILLIKKTESISKPICHLQPNKCQEDVMRTQ